MAKRKEAKETDGLSSILERNITQPNEEQPIRTAQRRRKRRSFKDTLDEILSMTVTPSTVADAVRRTALGDNISYAEAILLAQVIKASNGDTQAAVFIRDTSGNKLKERERELLNKRYEDF